MSRPEPDPEDRPVAITTTITHFQWATCKRKNWKYSEVFKAGFAVLVNGGELSDRVRQLEDQVKFWSSRYEKAVKKSPLVPREPMRFS